MFVTVLSTQESLLARQSLWIWNSRLLETGIIKSWIQTSLHPRKHTNVATLLNKISKAFSAWCVWEGQHWCQYVTLKSTTEFWFTSYSIKVGQIDNKKCCDLSLQNLVTWAVKSEMRPPIQTPPLLLWVDTTLSKPGPPCNVWFPSATPSFWNSRCNTDNLTHE